MINSNIQKKRYNPIVVWQKCMYKLSPPKEQSLIKYNDLFILQGIIQKNPKYLTKY